MCEQQVRADARPKRKGRHLSFDAFLEAQRSRIARTFESHVDRVRRVRFDPDIEAVADAEDERDRGAKVGPES